MKTSSFPGSDPNPKRNPIQAQPRQLAGENSSIAELFSVLFVLFQRLLLGLPRIAAALVNRLRELVSGQHQPNSLSWVKVGAIVLVAFVFFRRDNRPDLYRSPLSIWKNDDKRGARNNTAGFALAASNHSSNPFAPASPALLNDREVSEYVDRFSKVAVAEMNKFNIPASVSMAQALIESRSGESKLAQANNNHFGIKCFSKRCRKGHCTNFSDDHHKDFFRKFGTAWESWREHSKLLAGSRYQQLQQFGRNYKDWARGLEELGYASDDEYSEKLIEVIEKYELYKLDQH